MKYQKILKPDHAIVDAVQWDGENTTFGFLITLGLTGDIKGDFLEVLVPGGIHRARRGDWVIKAWDGKFSVCKAMAFLQMYEPYEEPPFFNPKTRVAAKPLDRLVAEMPEEKVRLFYRQLIEDDCELDTLIRKSALRVLPEKEVHGDSFFVPTTVCIVESLVAKIEAFERDEKKRIERSIVGSGTTVSALRDRWESDRERRHQEAAKTQLDVCPSCHCAVYYCKCAIRVGNPGASATDDRAEETIRKGAV